MRTKPRFRNSPASPSDSLSKPLTPAPTTFPWANLVFYSAVAIGLGLLAYTGVDESGSGLKDFLAQFPKHPPPTLARRPDPPSPISSPKPPPAPPAPTPKPLPSPVPSSPPAPSPIPKSLPSPPPAPGADPKSIYRRAYGAIVVVRNSNGMATGAMLSQGYIITNQHVVKTQPIVTIETVQGLSYQGIVRAVDPVNDLALVQITTPLRLPTLDLNVRPLEIGQTVYAVGNPIGLARTFTKGMISRFENNGDIVHTAESTFGSSGSPLLDEQGRVIGIHKAEFRDFNELGIATSAIAAQRLIDRTRSVAPSP